MADENTLFEDMARRTFGKAPIGKRIAFDLQGEGFILLDGASDPVSVSKAQPGIDADATIVISPDDLAGLLDGSIDGQSLMMTGRAKMKGNPMAAMKLRELLQ